jgi:hypothetical protein
MLFPRRSYRRRRRLAWIALAFEVFLCATFLLTTRWRLDYSERLPWIGWKASLCRSCFILVLWDPRAPKWASFVPIRWGCREFSGSIIWRPAIDHGPGGAKSGKETMLYAPLWIPSALLAPLAAFLCYRWYQVRDRPGCCVTCGYNLAGLPNAPCPECGHTAAEKAEKAREGPSPA